MILSTKEDIMNCLEANIVREIKRKRNEYTFTVPVTNESFPGAEEWLTDELPKLYRGLQVTIMRPWFARSPTDVWHIKFLQKLGSDEPTEVQMWK